MRYEWQAEHYGEFVSKGSWLCKKELQNNFFIAEMTLVALVSLWNSS
jgi:hypothetical protein